MSEIRQNIEKITEEIKEAAIKAGRKPESVKLMAVTKTKPVICVEEAYQAGARLFGENRVNELSDKFSLKREGLSVHLIGHLQRNKTKIAVRYADSIDSVDKYDTAFEIDKHSKALNKIMDILLEYNTSGEESKSGFISEKDFFEAVDRIRELGFVRIKGLMTIAPFTDSEKEISSSFRKLSSLYNSLSVKHPDLPLETLSMGMSSDFRIAIEEGSNIIRIGTGIFGERNY